MNEPVLRDGKPYPPQRAEDVVLCAGAYAALKALRDEGFALICVSNQPDIARGTASPADVTAINDVLARSLPLDDILVCPHDDADACDCRKPKPGLLEEGARRHGIAGPGSYMVGDRWRDRSRRGGSLPHRVRRSAATTSRHPRRSRTPA